ncbi:glutamate dehydrogenase [Janibacter sp. Soil728]|uniref:Glu/Leu/Phe/Val dehydrogenase dimerization domain-containing protein n=1 Tax=Janibacter sp. Soil728 TaxID=1736393 RepID=UPI0006FA5694|nr:Glu/Leu/Phe/Val dehydrogenase dimerization domain-containing protein [Janibacter sp. Soil728]KRE39229.1 glutamate dehydrogenase [Janibacter sp. Soil728]
MTLTHPTNAAQDFVDRAPAHEEHWVDPVTGAHGYLVVHTLVCDIATGGTRMRAGCTRDEVADLARGMATKTAAFGLPVGGAKGGIDFDPKDPRAFGVLTRFFERMRPWLDGHWVTAEDLGVTQQLIDGAFEEIGLSQSFHAAITRSPDPAATLERVHAGLGVMTDGLPLGDIIGGYGVAQACLGVAEGFGWSVEETEVTIQGIGTMGGGAAWYLQEAGAKVTAVADARGTLFDPAGLDVHALLELRDGYGEIDRSQVPARVQQLDRDAILGITADIFVPAAVSYAIREDNVEGVAARVVVEAANAASTWAAEDTLVAKGIPVVPDFIANTGAAAWAWWLLQGQVGTDPEDSFRRLSTEMRSKVAVLAEHWLAERIPMRQTAFNLASTNLRLLDGAQIVIP